MTEQRSRLVDQPFPNFVAPVLDQLGVVPKFEDISHLLSPRIQFPDPGQKFACDSDRIPHQIQVQLRKTPEDFHRDKFTG
jgi:hypothetical protein